MSAAEPIRLADRSLARRIGQVFEQHGRLGRLCDELEVIADDLPKACPRRCARAMTDLETLVPEHHAFDAKIFDELFAERQGDLLKRITDQHAEDEGLAFEIAIALEPIATGLPPQHPETLGYMLRCFFHNYRRSMLVEELAMRAACPGSDLPTVTGTRRNPEAGL
jgi:hypothetical protein